MRFNIVSHTVPVLFLPLILCLSSCGKESGTSDVPEEMTFRTEGSFDASVETKTTAVTAVPSSLFWAATDGEGASEKQVYASRLVALSGGEGHTDCWWPSTSKDYRFYLSNVSMSVYDGAGASLSAVNTKDVIAGSAAAPYRSVPAVALGHVFARTGTFNLSCNTGYVVSDMRWYLESKDDNTGTAGTYNITGDTWSGCTRLPQTEVTSSSDLYLIPGRYILTVVFTLSRPNDDGIVDYSDRFTKSAVITLVSGSRNTVNARTALDTAEGIDVSVDLSVWDTSSLTVSILS